MLRGSCGERNRSKPTHKEKLNTTRRLTSTNAKSLHPKQFKVPYFLNPPPPQIPPSAKHPQACNCFRFSLCSSIVHWQSELLWAGNAAEWNVLSPLPETAWFSGFGPCATGFESRWSVPQPTQRVYRPPNSAVLIQRCRVTTFTKSRPPPDFSYSTAHRCLSMIRRLPRQRTVGGLE